MKSINIKRVEALERIENNIVDYKNQISSETKKEEKEKLQLKLDRAILHSNNLKEKIR